MFATLAAALAVLVRILDPLVARSLDVGLAASVATTAGGCWWARRRTDARAAPYRKRPDAQDVQGTLAVVGAAVVLVVGLGITLVPRIASSDFGSHGGLVTWIDQHHEVPSLDEWSSSLAVYPTGGHVVAASGSAFTPLEPLESLWIVAILGVVGQWPLVMLLGRLVRSRTTARAQWLSAAGVLLLVVGLYRYTIGIATFDFFFAQLWGLFLAVAAVTRAGLALHRNEPPSFWVLPVGVLTLGSLLAYPQGSVVAGGAALALLFTARMPTAVRRLIMFTIVCAVVGGVLYLRTTVYWSRFLLAGGAGEVARPTLSLFGGPLAIAACALGVVVLLRHRARAASVVVGAALGPALVIAGMVSLRAGFPVEVEIADYRIAKNLYGLVPFAAVIGGVGLQVAVDWLLGGLTSWSAGPLAELRRTIRGTLRGTFLGTLLDVLLGVAAPAAMVAVLAVGLIAVRDPKRAAVRPIYDRDLYQLGMSLPERLRTATGVPGPWVTVNAMRWAGIGPMVSAVDPITFPRELRWDNWPAAPVLEDYLLVSGPLAARYLERPGVRVVERRGAAVLLTRLPK
jgi:hypothetical protein